MIRKLMFLTLAIVVGALCTMTRAQAQTITYSTLNPIIMTSAAPDATHQTTSKSTWGQVRRMYQGDGSLKVVPDHRATPQGGTLANQQWWRSLSQSQRNELIRQEAYNEMRALGGNVNVFSSPSGYVCKTWIQHLVPIASRYVAGIPDSDGDCRWSWGQYVSIVGYGPAGVSVGGSSPGNIVQSHWGSGPHTYMVWSKDSNGIWMIDCNFDWHGGLTIHYKSYADIEKASGGCYTVYQVIGG